MTLRLGNVTMDCTDAPKVAAFWSAALERPVDEGGNPFFVSIGRESAGPAMFFIAVPEPKSVKNRVHLDLIADDRRAEIERLVGLGATFVADKDEWGVSWTVMHDPEGNEFCIAADH
ncbi:MAG: VOC family protein [Actinomycetota bacterium]